MITKDEEINEEMCLLLLIFMKHANTEVDFYIAINDKLPKNESDEIRHCLNHLFDVRHAVKKMHLNSPFIYAIYYL